MASKNQEFAEDDPLVEPSFRLRSKLYRTRKICYPLVALTLGALLCLLVGLAIGFGNRSHNDPLFKSVESSNLMIHLRKLEEIANNQSPVSRAVAYGYNESADMVYEELEKAGYQVEKQFFKVGVYEDLGNSSFSAVIPTTGYSLSFLKDSQYSLMRYSGSTDGEEVSGILSVVAGNGCDVNDYNPSTIALGNYVSNSTQAGCTLYEMALYAEMAGVHALVMARTEDDEYRDIPPTTRIYNQTVDDFQVVDIPVLGATYQLGESLRSFLELGNVELSVATHTSVTMWNTYNVLAYTSGGKQDSVIVVGSHLDSVPAGPGINDNGSGSGANLEIALQIANQGITPTNKVLFAFWGAEELGLLGSTHFVMDAKEQGTIDNIVLNLNFDMIGSPNYVRHIYNGSGAVNEEIVEGSTKIQNLFEDHFKSEGLLYKLSPFNGRSDYGPFIEEGVDIPAGGLETGNDEIKSSDERSTYGGLAGAILDPCYHQACDTVDNINQEVYEQMSQAAASVLDTLMMKENLKEYLEPQSVFYYDD